VLAVLGLEGDIHTVAADDKVGRKLQDLALQPSSMKTRKRPPDSEPDLRDKAGGLP
jgi:hypothetical protein